jgi:hypothetical protein
MKLQNKQFPPPGENNPGQNLGRLNTSPLAKLKSINREL